MSPFFIVKGQLNKEVLEELEKHLLSPGFNCLIYVSMFFFSIVALLFLLLKSFLISMIFAIIVFLIYAEKKIGTQYCIRKALKSIGKPGDRLEFVMHFYDDFFTVEGNDDKRLKINYVHIKRIVETEHSYTLFTKESICFPVLKDSFMEKSKNSEWLCFLLKQNHKIHTRTIQKAR